MKVFFKNISHGQPEVFLTFYSGKDLCYKGFYTSSQSYIFTLGEFKINCFHRRTFTELFNYGIFKIPYDEHFSFVVEQIFELIKRQGIFENIDIFDVDEIYISGDCNINTVNCALKYFREYLIGINEN